MSSPRIRGYGCPARSTCEAAITRGSSATSCGTWAAAAVNYVVGTTTTSSSAISHRLSGSGVSVDLNLEATGGQPQDLAQRRHPEQLHRKTGRDYYQTVGIMEGYTMES